MTGTGQSGRESRSWKTEWEVDMRRLSLILFSVLALALTMVAAGAQDKYPSRVVKVIVPYGPGGATDIVGRILGEQLHQSLGEAFVVENRPGAYGIIAIEAMSRARPDGYTVMIGNVSTNAITPLLFPQKFSIKYDRDVVAVSRLVDVPAFVAATMRDFPPKTFAELIAHARQNPGKVRYGSVGVGSYPHFDMAVLANRAGLDLVHIPNKSGASGIINDMIRGDVQVSFINVASAGPMVQAGQLRALAVVADQRLPDYPDVPTMAEVGYPGVGTLAWQGMFAPAGTPKEVLATLHQAIVAGMKAPAVVKAFEQQNFRLVPSTSIDAAKTWLADELAVWRKITDEVKIEVVE
jgi:tripartite-type tricarboxylate transporter receptor subunit TctC